MEHDPSVFIATNFSVPAVGSSPWGILGYADLADELMAQLGHAPGWVIIPTSRADLAWGVYEGFRRRGGPLPRLGLVEPFARLSRALKGDWRASFPGEAKALASIDGDTVTFQAIQALHETKGLALDIPEEAFTHWHAWAWAHGYPLEPSGSVGIAAAAKLAEEGRFEGTDVVV